MNLGWIELARRWVPKRFRYAVQRFVSLSDVKHRFFAERNPLSGVVAGDVNTYGPPVRVGILKGLGQRHTRYVAACMEIGVPFRVVDLLSNNWLGDLKASQCDLFVIWPDANLTPVAKLMKDRCDLIERHLGCVVVPSSREHWMYEDKVRTYDWLRVHDVPHPRTWLFQLRSQAEEFAARCELPIVFKTAFGAQASGVRILRSRSSLRREIARAFGRGHVPAGHDRRDRQWGKVILQEYLDVRKEWRMVRMGEAYFGHPKGRSGEFHSGSGVVEWDVPQPELLELLHDVTELGGLRGMNLDVFETTDGRLLVNEMQTVFGARYSVDQMRVDGVAGRMVRSASGWAFEAGDFARNACANARVLDALEVWARSQRQVRSA